VHEDVRDLIDQAARVNGKTRSDFMVEAARQAAVNALAAHILTAFDSGVASLDDWLRPAGTRQSVHRCVTHLSILGRLAIDRSMQGRDCVWRCCKSRCCACNRQRRSWRSAESSFT